MAKRQTRRSISVKGITYQRIKGFCDANGSSVSGYLEEIIAEKMEAAGVDVTPEMEKAAARTYPTRSEPEGPVEQYFTF